MTDVSNPPTAMAIHSCSVTCPTCFETFEVACPPLIELPAELDYDCEVCCSPMLIFFGEDEGEIVAEARGLDD